jgi:hypothetical protein
LMTSPSRTEPDPAQVERAAKAVLMTREVANRDPNARMPGHLRHDRRLHVLVPGRRLTRAGSQHPSNAHPSLPARDDPISSSISSASSRAA